MTDEVEFVDECPSCGMAFVGMTPQEFRQGHAVEDCPRAPLPKLIVFPEDEEELVSAENECNTRSQDTGNDQEGRR